MRYQGISHPILQPSFLSWFLLIRWEAKYLYMPIHNAGSSKKGNYFNVALADWRHRKVIKIYDLFYCMFLHQGTNCKKD